jgi:hypothetical protein
VCGPGNAEQCAKKKTYYVLTAKIGNANETAPRICFAKAHWLVLPTAACTGIESSNPACTGSTGEKLYQSAWEEAMAHGLAPPTAAVMANAPNYRSQHQLHIHVAPLVAASNPIVTALLAEPSISADVARPTVTRVTGAEPVLVSVLVPGTASPADVAKRVAPLRTAAAVMRAASPAPGQPYGVMLSQRAEGFVVTGVLFAGDGDLVDISIYNDAANCVDSCAVWQQN